MPFARTVLLFLSATLLSLCVNAQQSADAPQRPAILGPETGTHISYDCGIYQRRRGV